MFETVVGDILGAPPLLTVFIGKQLLHSSQGFVNFFLKKNQIPILVAVYYVAP